jgi:hypothetical protein
VSFSRDPTTVKHNNKKNNNKKHNAQKNQNQNHNAQKKKFRGTESGRHPQ